MQLNNFQLLAAEEERHLSDQAIKQLQRSESNLTGKLRLFRMLGATVDLYSSRFAEVMTSMVDSVPSSVEASAKGMAYVLNEMTVDSSTTVYPWSYVALSITDQEDEESLMAQVGAVIEDILIQLELPISSYYLVSIHVGKSRAILRLEEHIAEHILNSFRVGRIRSELIEALGWYDYEGGAFRLPMEDSLLSLTRSIKVLMANNQIGKAIDQAIQYFKDKNKEIYHHFLAQKVELAVVQNPENSTFQMETGLLKVERGIRRILDRMP